MQEKLEHIFKAISPIGLMLLLMVRNQIIAHLLATVRQIWCRVDSPSSAEPGSDAPLFDDVQFLAVPSGSCLYIRAQLLHVDLPQQYVFLCVPEVVLACANSSPWYAALGGVGERYADAIERDGFGVVGEEEEQRGDRNCSAARTVWGKRGKSPESW